MSKHDFWMKRALALAETGSEQFSAPNPHVGCIIVNGGEIVGEGHSDPAGGNHAEVNALRQVKEKAQGATVYVTLEPCNHQGRTGPCTQALIDAGVAEVVYATADPSAVAGGGGARLTAEGIRVKGGILESNARHIHRQFLYSTHLKRPFVTVKAGISLDGRIALPTGESKWITSEASRFAVQKLRAERGCVLIGAKTALVDQARLTVRDFAMQNPPTRVVIDSHGTLPPDLPVFDSQAPSIRFTPQPSWEIDREWKDIDSLLGDLYRDGHNGLLVEGGAKTIGTFLKSGLVDEIVLFVAPIILGDGKGWVEGLSLESLSRALAFEFSTVQEVKPDPKTASDHPNLRITFFSRNLSNFLTSE